MDREQAQAYRGGPQPKYLETWEDKQITESKQNSTPHTDNVYAPVYGNK